MVIVNINSTTIFLKVNLSLNQYRKLRTHFAISVITAVQINTCNRKRNIHFDGENLNGRLT